MLVAISTNELKKTRNREDVSARLEFAIIERVKANSFYPRPQETVNPFAQRRAAHAARVMAMTSSLPPTFYWVPENRMRRKALNVSARPSCNGCEATARLSNQHARRIRYPDQLRAPGLGGGVGRGLGVKCGLAVGVGLGVGVGLPETVAVAVAVGVAGAVGDGVDVGVIVGVALPKGVAVTVAVAVAVGVGLIVAVAVAVAVAVGVAVTVAVAVEVAVAVAVGVDVGDAVAVGVGVPAGTRKA